MAINPKLLVSAAMLQDLLVDVDGTPLSAGTVTAYIDNTNIFKNWYYQSGTAAPYTYLTLPNPMTLSAAGTIVDNGGNDTIPFYYPVNEADNVTPQLYKFVVQNSNGTTVFTRYGFPATGNGGGGGGGGGAGSNVQNYIINNRLWRNVGTVNVGTLTNNFMQSYNTTSPQKNYYYQTLAPSQHDGFSMPDLNYIKDANGDTETITFNSFTLSDAPSFVGQDVRPEFYINHNCTVNTAGTTLKVYQFPISLHINTLQDSPFSFTIWTQSISGISTINIYIYQFLGTGETSPMPVGIATITLQTGWTKFTLNAQSFASSTGQAVSLTADDAFYLQIGMPKTGAFNLNFAIPSIYLNGTTTPTNDFSTYDQIDSVVNSPRTGDVRTSLNTFYPYGWVPMNDGTLVAPGSITAPTNGSGVAYQGPDAFPLYNLLWNAFKAYDTGSDSNPIAQMYSSAGAADDYGTTALADWIALKQIALSKMMGRVILGSVPLPSTQLASTTNPLIYKTTYTAPQITTSVTFTKETTTGLWLVTGAPATVLGQQVQFTGTIPSNMSLATNYFILPASATTYYVCTSLANAQAEIAIPFNGSSPSGTSMITSGLVLTSSNAINLFPGAPVIFSNTGGTFPGGISNTAVFYAVPITSTIFTVATSFSNAISGDYILYTSAGTPTNTVTIFLSGTYIGEYTHTQLAAELALHNHGPIGPAVGFWTSTASTGTNTASAGSGLTSQATTGNTGSSIPMNNVQPATFYNMYIKL